MSHRSKSFAIADAPTCEKYLSKLLRQENLLAARKSQGPKKYQEKFSHLLKVGAMQPPKGRPRSNPPPQSPTQKIMSPQKEHEVNHKKHRNRSESENRSGGKEREPWGQMLISNKSKEKVSNFSNFDPLRTLHFLSKELYSKLRNILPADEEVVQMVSDIQHALRRIPPEVSTLLHNPNVEYPQLEKSSYLGKSTATKTCQTPPTLYQEDTEKFQKIMEENTYRLEASCKQLEVVCTNLQNEKEMTEKELDEARENVDLLCKRVKELEAEIEQLSTTKIVQLEDEKRHLQKELEEATKEVTNNPSLNHLKKLVEELKKQKKSSDETCARLEYDMTLLKMEKEKFVTMLSIRDKEIKEIQDEMSKIQDQVNKQLKKLNGEVVQRANSMRTVSDPFIRAQDNLFLEIGDTTISSVTTNESDREHINGIKESPCGDGEVTKTKESQNDSLHKLKANNVELDLPSVAKEKETGFEDLLKELSPSLRSMLTSHNLI